MPADAVIAVIHVLAQPVKVVAKVLVGTVKVIVDSKKK